MTATDIRGQTKWVPQRRKEVVQRYAVRKIRHAEVDRRLVAISLQKVIRADRERMYLTWVEKPESESDWDSTALAVDTDTATLR